MTVDQGRLLQNPYLLNNHDHFPTPFDILYNVCNWNSVFKEPQNQPVIPPIQSHIHFNTRNLVDLLVEGTVICGFLLVLIVFWVVTPRGLEGLAGGSPEDGDTISLRNAGINIRVQTASQPRTSLPQWKHQISHTHPSCVLYRYGTWRLTPMREHTEGVRVFENRVAELRRIY